MPFFTDNDPGGFRSDTASAPPLPKFAPDASDVAGAAFRSTNTVVSTHPLHRQFRAVHPGH
jgi:hypothetical protein